MVESAEGAKARGRNNKKASENGDMIDFFLEKKRIDHQENKRKGNNKITFVRVNCYK